jgi:hypothetical protein
MARAEDSPRQLKLHVDSPVLLTAEQRPQQDSFLFVVSALVLEELKFDRLGRVMG